MTATATATATTTSSVPGSRRAGVLPWMLTLVLLAGAWVLNTVALPDSAPRAPFVTAAETGRDATAGNLAVTVTDVRAARSVTDAEGWTAAGTWLVIELDAAAVRSQYGAQLSTAELMIGDRAFHATERGRTFFRSDTLVPGVMRRGALAFELPDGALRGQAVLRLGASRVTAGAGVVELAIVLDEIPVEDSVTLPLTSWADR